MVPVDTGHLLDSDDMADLDDAPDNEVEKVETEILDKQPLHGASKNSALKLLRSSI